MKGKIEIKTKENGEIEDEIVRIIQKKIGEKQIPVAELEKMILEEIEKAKYLSEDWQKHYAKERIKEEVKGKRKKQSDKFLLGLFKWKLDGKELKNQIENYSTLSFFKSARKIATAFIIFSAIITLIFTMVDWFPSETWIDVVLILILAFFVYKGEKWAMIVAMIYWTFSKGLQVVGGFSVENFSAGNIIMPVIWWAIVMGVFYKAYQVERERKKINSNFCSSCGAKIKNDAIFCPQCGERIKK